MKNKTLLLFLSFIQVFICTSTVTAQVFSAMEVNVQNYRKWDFTNWSNTTVENLKAEDAVGGITGAGWSSTEIADGRNPQPGNCYWSYSETNVVNGTLQANGSAIAETEGLLFNPAYAAKRYLAIAINYPSTSVGEYASSQYLWLGGKNNLYCFIIPKVKIGQKITFEVESHKTNDTRGVSLFVKDINDDLHQIGESFLATNRVSYTLETWTLPAGAKTNEDGTVDILVNNTSGCHIYRIELGDKTQMATIKRNGLWFVLNAEDHTATVVREGDIYSGNLEIPGSVEYNGDTYDVTSLHSTFKGCSEIKSVLLPNTLKSIDIDAFADCISLTSLIIPDSVTTIGSNAFSGCTGLSNITIPDSVSTIGNRALYGCI